MFTKKEYLKEFFSRIQMAEHEQYYDDFLEQLKWKRQDYYLTHKDKLKECASKWQKENKERVSEYMKKYYQTPKGKALSQRGESKRRAILKEVINTLTADEWLETLEEHDYRCVYCGKKLIDSFDTTRDHVIPLNKGGNNTKDNILPACRSCNCKKGGK